MSEFKLQIVHKKDNAVVEWKPGSPLEVDIAEELCNRLKVRGVGMFASEEKVLTAVREEFASILWILKSRV